MNKELTKEEIINLLKKKEVEFNKLDNKWRSEKEVVLAAVVKNGWALQYASNELRNNEEIALAAVSQNGFSLKYSSDRLKNNKNIVLAALKQDKNSFEYSSDELKNNKKFIELYLNNFELGDCGNPALYKESVKKLEILNNQDWMENNIISNKSENSIKPKKF